MLQVSQELTDVEDEVYASVDYSHCASPIEERATEGDNVGADQEFRRESCEPGMSSPEVVLLASPALSTSSTEEPGGGSPLIAPSGKEQPFESSSRLESDIDTDGSVNASSSREVPNQAVHVDFASLKLATDDASWDEDGEGSEPELAVRKKRPANRRVLLSDSDVDSAQDKHCSPVSCGARSRTDEDVEVDLSPKEKASILENEKLESEAARMSALDSSSSSSSSSDESPLQVRKRKGTAKKKPIVMSDSEDVESPSREITGSKQSELERDFIVVSDVDEDSDHATASTKPTGKVDVPRTPLAKQALPLFATPATPAARYSIL
jgi:hypothetical protein